MNKGKELTVFGFTNLHFDSIKTDDSMDGFNFSSHTIEFSASVENMKDVDEILAGDNTFDIVIKDERGNEYKRERQEIIQTPIIHRRIPRKMKKALKKRHSDMWKYYHPNSDVEIVIRDKR